MIELLLNHSAGDQINICTLLRISSLGVKREKRISNDKVQASRSFIVFSALTRKVGKD